MSLYDDVKCEYKLPGATREVQKDVFQTKNFECAMDNYTITEGGELIHHVHEYESVPEEERPHYGTPEWDQKLYKLVGCMRSKFVKDVKVNHHGIIFIYTITKDKEWWEYMIKFTDGKIIDVERLNKNYED